MDYYALLEVPKDSSTHDIKKAFRKKAKSSHPDVASDKKSSDEMLKLLDAYRILTNPEKRRIYDRILRKEKFDEGFNYRNFLKERRFDPESQAKLVFYDLLHDRDSEAVEVYEKNRFNPKFAMERYFERPEAMDAELYIAEYYESKGKFLKSFLMYKKLIAMEFKKPAFGYYFETVLDKFCFLIENKMAKTSDKEDLIDRIDEALHLGVPSKHAARILKARAEALISLSRFEEAVSTIESARVLYPSLKGLDKCARKAGIE